MREFATGFRLLWPLFVQRIIPLLQIVLTTTYTSALQQPDRFMVFPFVHSCIADVLECRPPDQRQQAKTTTTTTTHTPYTYLVSNGDRLQIQDWPSESNNFLQPAILSQKQSDALSRLAHECDDFVFLQERLEIDKTDVLLHQVMDWGRTTSDKDVNSSAQLVLATLLALNRLETSIRQTTVHQTIVTTAGRAPLLKNMIAMLVQQQHQQQLNTTNTNKDYCCCSPQVLQALLLPNPGLNLRNLLWHGFVATIPRPWLALTVVLVVILEQQSTNFESTVTATAAAAITPNCIPSLRKYAAFHPILERGDNIVMDDNLLQSTNLSWIKNVNSSNSGSYHSWWKLVRHWVQTKQYPLSICILLTCLLEHGLRQLWCCVNHRRQDAIALPNTYYVTLDGHGQRHQHDVVLHPYVSDYENDNCSNNNNTKNALVEHLGGPIMALLSDLYCSPCGGPNLRASLSHGLWEAHLEVELAAEGGHNEQSEKIWDIVKVLLVLMEETGNTTNLHAKVSFSTLQGYRSQFSYSAATFRNLEFAMNEIFLLEAPFATTDGQERLKMAKSSTHMDSGLLTEQLFWPRDRLQRLADNVLHIICSARQDIFHEHDTNRVLACNGAARTLLLDVAEACDLFRTALDPALVTPPIPSTNGAPSSRQRKQRIRVIAASELALLIYTFVTATALLLLEHDLCADQRTTTTTARSTTILVVDRNVLLQAVKRSRMTLSTVSNYICTNSDRAIKAAKDYSKGKAVQTIQKQLRNESSS